MLGRWDVWDGLELKLIDGRSRFVLHVWKKREKMIA